MPASNSKRTKSRFLISIVVPVHNEEAILEQNIQGIVEGLEAIDHFDWEVLIVENGSRDQTLAIAQGLSQRYPAVRVMQSTIANYGAALQQGFLAAQGDLIVNFDIDYWDLEFVEIAAHVMRVKYEIVIASKNLLLSRDQRGGLRKVASYTFRMILFFVFGLRVSDTHGIKAWRNSPQMREYFAASSPGHHTYDSEVIIRAMHDNCEVLEVPIHVVETRTSDRHILKRVPQTLKELWSIYQRLPHSS